MYRSPKTQVIAAVMLLGLIASACSEPSQSGVSVRSLATDLVYGIPEPEKPAPPANFDPVPPDPIGTVFEGGEDTDDDIQIPQQPPPDPCPPTPPNVFPPAAPSEVEGRPAEGRYRWPMEGYQEVETIGRVRMPPFAFRSVFDVQDTSDGYSFVVEERELTFGSKFIVRTTYEVITETGLADETDDRGIYLTKIERFHPDDSSSNREFNPSPAILLLPLPAALGNEINSVGADPVSFEVMRLEGGVTERRRVDACGEPMDTFYIEAQQTRVAADGSSSTRKFDYGIATNLGGMIIVEHIESPCVENEQGECQEDAVRFLLDTHIGQLEPDPLLDRD